MNFDGVVLAPGSSDDATADRSAVLNVPADLPPYLDGDPQRATKIAAIADEVRAILAPFDIRIATERPASGSYHMVVFTSAAGEEVGVPSARAILPITCNTVPSGIAFQLADGMEPNRHVLAQHTIGMFGIFNGIPSSTKPDDCMCYLDSTCVEGNSTGPCTLGGPNTPVSDSNSCAGGGGTMDVRERFFEQFGAAP
jgi:hypothetical protein